MTSFSSKLAFFQNASKMDNNPPQIVKYQKIKSKFAATWSTKQKTTPIKITPSYSPSISLANEDEKIDEYLIWTQYMDKNGVRPSSAFQLSAFTNKTADIPSINILTAKRICKKYKTTVYKPVSKHIQAPKKNSKLWHPIKPQILSSAPFNGLTKIALSSGKCQVCLEQKENILTTHKCGHKLCKTCMRIYIKFAPNKHKIQCPEFKCSLLLSQYHDIQCVLSKEEYSKMYLKKLLSNLSAHYYGNQMCLTACFNEIPLDRIGSNGKLECFACNESWCIHCTSPWHEGLNCDQSYSAQRDSISDILLTCDVKTIGCVANVPSIRCCPNCKAAINHTMACKHMLCRCSTYFCFVCLVVYDAEFGWKCGGSSDICPIAPRQVVMEME